MERPLGVITLINSLSAVLVQTHGPLARYGKLRVAHAPGMPRMFSLLSRVSDPGMHHGTASFEVGGRESVKILHSRKVLYLINKTCTMYNNKKNLGCDDLFPKNSFCIVHIMTTWGACSHGISSHNITQFIA